jgi:hypothetical protein
VLPSRKHAILSQLPNPAMMREPLGHGLNVSSSAKEVNRKLIMQDDFLQVRSEIEN